MEHIVLPNVAQNEYMIARNLHSSYIGVNVLEACNMAILFINTIPRSIIHFETSQINII